MGAGASIHAGVPDTKQFVKEYANFLTLNNESDKIDVFNKMSEVIRKWVQRKNKDFDIEILLETLYKLKNKEDEILLDFYENNNYILTNFSSKSPIIEEIKDFIRKKCIVDRRDIRYFDELLNFIRTYETLHIFTVNYDICIELFCNLFKLKFTDGFDINWNPKLFGENFQVKLYKLHGSITWYKSDQGTYIKMPILPEKPEYKLTTGETVSSFILYPLNKFEYNEPLFTLLNLLKERLLNSDFAIIVGYSFRDDYLKEIFWDVAKENQNLILLLVDPNAESIYERIRYYPGKIPSSLEGKVINLSYNFEVIIPFLKNSYLRTLKAALINEKVHLQNISEGRSTNWEPLLDQFLDIEYYNKVSELMESNSLNWKKFPLELQIKYLLKLAIFFLSSDDFTNYEKYKSDLSQILELDLKEQLEIQINTVHDKMILLLIFKSGGSSSLDPKTILNGLNFINNYFNFKIKSNIKDEKKGKIKDLFSKMKKLEAFLDFWKDGFEVKTYYENRLTHIKELGLPDYTSWDGKGRRTTDFTQVKIALEKMEKKIFGDILPI